MIISLNWLKKYVDVDLSVDELVTRIGERLVEIESVEYIGPKYKDVVVARVVECVAMENSDHLNVTKIDDGGVVEGVERDENGLIQVVCGAPNVHAGALVAWLPPQSIVPETYNDDEPFVLSARPLRGVVSQGMLASPRELALYDEHEGILLVDKELAPGTSFAEAYELDDYLLDIENKSLTHRPDTFGVIGFAREIAGIQGKVFSTPEWMLEVTAQGDVSADAPAVVIEDQSLSDRFMAVVLEGVNEEARSPIEMQTYLSRSGVRPISAAVDVSNYVMLATGQPSHTYDYDKLLAVAGNDATIRVRSGREGEKLTLLDGKEIELNEVDIVIAAGDTAIGLAGAMGGASTAVDDSTTRVLLEVATFDLYRLRATQMRHGIFSEAITRFTKGIPAPVAAPVLNEAVRLLGEYAGARVASNVADAYPGAKDLGSVVVSEAQINETLGTHFSAEDIALLLENVGFTVSFSDLVATVTVPYWRQDIHIPEDIIEEVGRLVGFDTIDITLPLRDFTAVEPVAFDDLRARIRHELVRAGANEVLTYSFVHGDILRRAGQNPDDSYRITNSISPELQYYRQSLTPSLLGLVHANIRAGHDAFVLFELNKVHAKSLGLNEESVPIEQVNLALTFAAAKSSKGASFYQAKRYLEHAARQLGVEFEYRALEDADGAIAAPFDAARSAGVYSKATGEFLGVVGEYARSLKKSEKLPDSAAGFELNLGKLAAVVPALAVRYARESRYPGTERDICFKVASGVAYADIASEAEAVLAESDLVTSVEPLDIYQQDGLSTKNITIRVKLASYDKTLAGDEVSEVIAAVSARVTEKTEGEVI